MCLSRQRRMKPVSPQLVHARFREHYYYTGERTSIYIEAFIISVLLYLLKFPTLLDRHEIIVMLLIFQLVLTSTCHPVLRHGWDGMLCF